MLSISETQIFHSLFNMGLEFNLLRTLIALKYIHRDFNTYVLLARN
jgi:hypothetical protein